MNFEINGRKWRIVEVAQRVFWEDDDELDKMNSREHYFGRTKYDRQEIWLDKDLPVDAKRKTLYHELMHCYKSIFICLYDLDNQNEDFWCDLSANSHDLIHAVVEKYMERYKEEETEESQEENYEETETCQPL